MADQFRTFDKAPIVSDVSIKGWSFAWREIIVAGVAAFCFVMCIIFISLYASEKSGDGDGGSVTASRVIQKHFCVTSECTETASHALHLMNKSVNPCDNFYEYACGNYKTDHPYINRQSGRSTLSDISDINDKRLLEIIEKPPSRTVPWAYQKKLTDFFKVCKDDYTRESLLGRPFLEQIVSKLGGWSLLGTWDESGWDFNTALKKVQTDFWVDAFYTTQVVIDAANPKLNVISVQPAGTAKWIRHDWYHDARSQKVRDDYKKFMRKVASLLMRDANLENVTSEERDARLDQFVNETFTFESQLAEATKNAPLGNEVFLDSNRVTVRDLNDETSGVIDWVDQLSYLYDEAKVSESTKLVLSRRDYYKNVSTIIQSLPSNDKNRILHNYLIWRSAEQYVQDLSWEYIHANRDLYVDINGYANFQGLEKYCMMNIHFYMKDALGAMFVEEHLAEGAKQKVLDITNNLKKAMLTTLEDTPWMDAPTKKYAKEKLDLVTFKMGYPDWMGDPVVVDKTYSSFDVNTTNFFGTLLDANQFARSEQSRTLVFGENRDEWIFGPYDTTVAVYWYWNEIIAPAGILQNPIYNHESPHFSTFGSLGAILGRYLHHVVDDWGQHYDKNGNNMGSGTWWSSKAMSDYRPIDQCVKKLYAHSYQTTTSSDGKDVQVALHHFRYAPVAIALTSGIRLALKGYKDWVADLGIKEKMLPSVSLNPDQMIFLSYAQSYCENRGDAQRDFLIRRGEPLSDLKINMAMQQLKEFSDAYKCKSGAKMNPKERCTYY